MDAVKNSQQPINIPKPFICGCLQLLQKYSIRTPKYLNDTDYQYSYALQYKFSRFPFVKKERKQRFP